MTLDASEIQEIVKQGVKEAIKTLPKPQVPSWLDSSIEFLKTHPLTSILIVVLIILVISIIIRELICIYLKNNEILARIKRIEEKLR